MRWAVAALILSGASAAAAAPHYAHVVGNFDAPVLFVQLAGGNRAFFVKTADGAIHASCDGGTSWQSTDWRPTTAMTPADAGLASSFVSELMGLNSGLAFSTRRATGLPGWAPACVQDHCPYTASFSAHGLPITRTLMNSGFASGNLTFSAPSLPGPSQAPDVDLTFMTDSVDPRRAWMSRDGDLFATTDCGGTWKPMNEAWAKGAHIVRVKQDYDSLHGPLFRGRDGLVRKPLREGYGTLTEEGGDLLEPESEPIYPDVVPVGIVKPPLNPSETYLLSSEGIHFSTDDGQTWTKISTESGERLYFADGGQTLLLVSGNVIKASTDRGVSWTAVDAKLPRGAGAVALNPRDPDQWTTVADRHVWLSDNRGRSFRPLYVATRSPEYAFYSRDVLFVLTDREVVRVSTNAGVQPTPDGLRLFTARNDLEPSLNAAIESTLQNLGLDETAMRAQLKARYVGLIPRVGAGIQYYTPFARSFFNSISGYDDNWDAYQRPDSRSSDEGDVWNGFSSLADEFAFARQATGPRYFFGLRAVWNTDELLYSTAAATVETAVQRTRTERERIVDEVRRLYGFRRQLLFRYLAHPPADIETRLAQSLVVEELTAHLDGLSGGLWSGSLEWLQQQRKEYL